MHVNIEEKADFKIANAFDGIEIINAAYKAQAFSRHVHEAYTIGVIEQGAQRFYRSGDVHIAETDSIILVNADDVHTGDLGNEIIAKELFELSLPILKEKSQ